MSQSDHVLIRMMARIHNDTKVQFGTLNLIVLTEDQDEDKYEAWRKGTEDLESIAPVTRDEAIAYFEHLGVDGYETAEIQGRQLCDKCNYPNCGCKNPDLNRVLERIKLKKEEEFTFIIREEIKKLKKINPTDAPF